MYSGGRALRLTGTHPEYLAGLNGSNADQSLIVQVTKDLPRDSVCFDVGANIGVTAISMAAHRPDLKIIAFEPVPDNARCMRRNIEVNGGKVAGVVMNKRTFYIPKGIYRRV